MNISCECVSCVISSAMELMAAQLPCEKHPQVTAQMLEHAARQDWQESPPEFARKLYMLLRDAGGVAEAFRCNAGQKLHSALHPHVHRETARLVQAVEQRTFRDLRADAVDGHELFSCLTDRCGDERVEVEFTAVNALCGIDEILRAESGAQRSEVLYGTGGKRLRCGEGIQRVRAA